MVNSQSQDPGNVNAPKQVAPITIASICIGILAIFPYLCYLLALLTMNISSFHFLWELVPLLFLFCFVCGFLFGLPAIITGIIGWAKQLKTKKNLVVALIGILLGLSGILLGFSGIIINILYIYFMFSYVYAQ